MLHEEITLMRGYMVSLGNRTHQDKKGVGKNQKENIMLYENQYFLEDLVRERIEAFVKESEEERLYKMAKPGKSEFQRYLPYASALIFIVIAIVFI